MWPVAMSYITTDRTRFFDINEQRIAPVISEAISRNQYPQKIRIPGIDIEGELLVHYTFNPALQQEAKRLLAAHNPDYGILVAIDPETGHILAMADNSRDNIDRGNLSIVNTYPAASVSKIITAVAALNEGAANPSSIIPFNGKATTLYKKNVFSHKNNKWTRKPTFSESFAKSVNTVFGRLGAVDLGGDTLLEYFHNMGFNSRFASDFIFGNGSIELEPTDQWQVAESASGYTNRNTLSPLHATVLAATAVNGGNLVAPVLVSSIEGPYGIPLYNHDEPAVTSAMDESTAVKLKQLMRATVREGSARKSFRKFHRGHRQNIIVGGKTGSLTGYNPKGRYDWFVGFAEQDGRKIAFAALCINKEKWYVKSARLAREFLEFYYAKPKSN